MQREVLGHVAQRAADPLQRGQRQPRRLLAVGVVARLQQDRLHPGTWGSLPYAKCRDVPSHASNDRLRGPVHLAAISKLVQVEASDLAGPPGGQRLARRSQ